MVGKEGVEISWSTLLLLVDATQIFWWSEIWTLFFAI
jgi:hypothetical protein